TQHPYSHLILYCYYHVSSYIAYLVSFPTRRSSDLFEMRNFAAKDAGNTEVNFRAVVKSGGKKLKSRTVEPVHPNEPQQVPRRKPPLWERMKSFFKDLFVPRLIPQSAHGWGSRIEDIDLENNRYRIQVSNLGGGIVRGAVL